MKKEKFLHLSITMLILMLPMLLSACGASDKYASLDETKPTVIATLFPQYDFARQIAGENANVVLLLPPGTESHSFDPSPADIIAIQNADVFLYTGPYMESWAADVTEGLESDVAVVDLSANISLVKEADIEAEYESVHAEEGAEHEEHEHSHEHSHTYDPHIWTNPVYAQIMTEDIAEALIKADPGHAEEYERNMQAYQLKLQELDAVIRDTVEHAKRKELFFGGRFAMYYFTREYGLTYESVYDSCSSETEPSVQSVMHTIREMREKEIPVIYYEELVDPRIARTIAEETGSQMLLWHSCHSVSKWELEEGVTYLDLMEQNLQNLEMGLN